MKKNPLSETDEKRIFARFCPTFPTLGLLMLAPLCACEPDKVEATPSILPAATPSTCTDNSALQTSLYGVIETIVAWSGSDMICENMRRLNGQGIRLRFAGDVAGEQLALIIALPELRAGQQDIETAANVTPTVEGSGRFFTTPGFDSCRVDVLSQTPLPGDSGSVELQGQLSCIAALGEVNGDANVSIPSLKFTTRIEWGEQ